MLTVMCYSLLLSLASATFISTLTGGEGGQMIKFVFLDVHLTLRKTRVKTQSVPTILSRVVLEYFVNKVCVQKQVFGIFHHAPILF